MQHHTMDRFQWRELLEINLTNLMSLNSLEFQFLWCVWFKHSI